MFGGEKFHPIIGDLSLGKLFSDMHVSEEPSKEAEGASHSTTPVRSKSPSAEVLFSKERQEESKKLHEERVKMLLENLKKKTEAVVGRMQSEADFRKLIIAEAQDLAKESYGPELLLSIGYVYETKASNYLTKDNWFGVKGFIGSLKEKGHIFSSIVDTVGAMREADPNRAKKASGQQQEEQDPYKKAQQEEGKVMNALWKANSLEVQLTLREVCAEFLSYASVPGYKVPLTVQLKAILKPTIIARAQALLIIGQIYRTTSEQIQPPRTHLH